MPPTWYLSMIPVTYASSNRPFKLMNSCPIFSSTVIAPIVASTQAMSSSLRRNGLADRSTTMLSSSTRVQVEIIVHHAATATRCHKLLPTRPPHPAAPVPARAATSPCLRAIHGNRLLPLPCRHHPSLTSAAAPNPDPHRGGP